MGVTPLKTHPRMGEKMMDIHEDVTVLWATFQTCSPRSNDGGIRNFSIRSRDFEVVFFLSWLRDCFIYG